jgi:N-acetylmuramoyl-L-alanine amidase
MKIQSVPSPNFGVRNTDIIDLLILHYTGMSDVQHACVRLCDESAEVSAHYLVGDDGKIFQLVDEDKRAWHAGVSSWRGCSDINSRSIGIEIQNRGHEGGLPEFPKHQISAVIALVDKIISCNGIIGSGILAHSDVAPERKIDPGERFPWKALFEAGIGVWLPSPGNMIFEQEEDACGRQIEAMQQKLQAIGYCIDVTGWLDPVSVNVITAFQRHWRPERVDGRADRATLLQIERIFALVNVGH